VAEEGEERKKSIELSGVMGPPRPHLEEIGRFKRQARGSLGRNKSTSENLKKFRYFRLESGETQENFFRRGQSWKRSAKIPAGEKEG